MDNYGRDEKLRTKAEHLLPPLGTYIVRKIVLGLVLLNIWTAKKLSRVYGFHMAAEVTDRDCWKWDLRKKLHPGVRAKLEKVD